MKFDRYKYEIKNDYKNYIKNYHFISMKMKFKREVEISP